MTDEERQHEIDRIDYTLKLLSGSINKLETEIEKLEARYSELEDERRKLTGTDKMVDKKGGIFTYDGSHPLWVEEPKKGAI